MGINRRYEPVCGPISSFCSSAATDGTSLDSLSSLSLAVRAKDELLDVVQLLFTRSVPCMMLVCTVGRGGPSLLSSKAVVRDSLSPACFSLVWLLLPLLLLLHSQ